MPVVIRARQTLGPISFQRKSSPFLTNAIDSRPCRSMAMASRSRLLHVDDHCRGIEVVIESGQNGDVTTWRRHESEHRSDAESSRSRPGIAHHAVADRPATTAVCLNTDSCVGSAGRRLSNSSLAWLKRPVVPRQRMVVAADQGKRRGVRAFHDAQYGSRPLRTA